MNDVTVAQSVVFCRCLVVGIQLSRLVALVCSAQPSLLFVSMGKNRTINNIIFVIKSDHFHGSGPSRNSKNCLLRESPHNLLPLVSVAKRTVDCVSGCTFNSELHLRGRRKCAWMWIGTCCIGRTVYYTASSAKHFLWHLQSSLCAIAAFHSTLCALTTTDDLYIARLTKAGWGCKYPTQTNSKRLYQQTLSMHTRAYLLVPFPPPLAGMPPVKGTFQSGGSFFSPCTRTNCDHCAGF